MLIFSLTDGEETRLAKLLEASNESVDAGRLEAMRETILTQASDTEPKNVFPIFKWAVSFAAAAILFLGLPWILVDHELPESNNRWAAMLQDDQQVEQIFLLMSAFTGEEESEEGSLDWDTDDWDLSAAFEEGWTENSYGVEFL